MISAFIFLHLANASCPEGEFHFSHDSRVGAPAGIHVVHAIICISKL